MIVWLNGAHGVGKTTTSALVQPLVPDSRVFDPEKVGEVLMNVMPALPKSDNFQHWPPWRPLVVETALRILDYVGGTLIMPMTVVVEAYWREISDGLSEHAIPVRHFVLHADAQTLRHRIGKATDIPSPFRLERIDEYQKAAQSWLQTAATMIDTTDATARQVAEKVARGVGYGNPSANSPIERRRPV